LPELWVDIWKAYLDGDWPRAAAAQKKARDTFDDIASIGGGFHALVKAALSERLGIDCGAPRLPAAPLTDEQRTALGRRLRELGLVGGQ